MAGFDYEFTYMAGHEPIVNACLAAARTRARKLSVSWRRRTVAPCHLLVIVDGNSRRTDLLGYRLERDLPLVAEGCHSDTLKPSERARLGRGFADLMLRGRNLEEDRVLSLKGVAETRYYHPPYEFECPGIPGLHARLSITLEVIVGWYFGEISPEVLLEELHTACELVLEVAVNMRARRLSFAELVRNASNSGLFCSPNADSGPALLIELKDLRKEVRHRAAQGAGPWLTEHWEDVAMLIEQLVHQVNAAASGEGG